MHATNDDISYHQSHDSFPNHTSYFKHIIPITYYYMILGRTIPQFSLIKYQQLYTAIYYAKSVAFL